MQQAYAAGAPQLAVASVTVVDPIVAVLMGVVLLGESAGVAWWVGAGEFIAGAVALGGVIVLATSQVSRKAVVVRDVLPQDLPPLDGRAADSRARTGHQLAYSGLPARG